jgi:RNA polymerase sigma factor (sigma-70 family)
MKDSPEPKAADIAAAFTEAVPRIRRMGVRFALDGEEVAQDACVRVLNAKSRPREINDPVGYLLRVARNLFIDMSRVRSREAAVRVRTLPSEFPREEVDPERLLVGKERLGVALAAIENLPPRCREAFRLHRFEGLSYTMIARRMGVSPSMIEKHIAEAMLRVGRAMRTADGSDTEA